MAHIAPCGFDCEGCPAYQTGQPARCEGCHAPSSTGSELCSFCAVRACALQRGVRVCVFCTLYPCAVIEQSFPAGTPARQALDKRGSGEYNNGV